MKNNIDKKSIEEVIKVDSILFFDMDGTLVDTNLANFLAYSNAIKEVSNSDLELKYEPNIRFNRSTLKSTLPDLPPIEYNRIVQKKEIIYDELLNETKLNTFLYEILKKYSISNKTVLVTNCRSERAKSTLNHHRLTDLFDVIFYRQFSENENKINKYQFAISSLAISPKNIIVFENEDQEINDAKIAGIPSINIFMI
jgi:beta-phosphoglucomutase